MVEYTDIIAPVSDSDNQIDLLEELPVYESHATPEQVVSRNQWRMKQEALIDEQIHDNVPAQHIKIRCGCHRFESWRTMVRCLYCGIWFCGACAQQHFGYQLPE